MLRRRNVAWQKAKRTHCFQLIFSLYKSISLSFFGFVLKEMEKVVFPIVAIDGDHGVDDDGDDGEREEGEECFLYESAADAIKFFSAAGDKSDVEQ